MNMADNMELMYARSTYHTLCKTLDNMNLRYDRTDDELKVLLGFKGDAFDLQFLVLIDADRQLIRIISLLPFNMNEDKIVEGSIAVAGINYLLADGSFDIDLTEGHVMFKMVSTFRDSIIGEDLIEYMVSIAYSTVNKYCGRLASLNDGIFDLDYFLESLENN